MPAAVRTAGAPVTGDPGVSSPVSNLSIPLLKSAAQSDPHVERSSGFFFKQVSMIATTLAGKSIRYVVGGGGVSFAIWKSSVPMESLLLNGFSPVVISYNITPSDQRSARPSTFLPETCSGLM